MIGLHIYDLVFCCTDELWTQGWRKAEISPLKITTEKNKAVKNIPASTITT